MKSKQPVSLIILVLLMGLSLSASAKDLKFAVLKTAESSGSLEAMVVSGGRLTAVRRLVHTAVLVRHPQGDVLWDTGIGRDIASQMESFSFLEQQLFSIENVTPARDQLEEKAYDWKALKAIIPSHLHWDHASGLEDFPGIPVWVLPKGLREARSGQPPAFIQSQYDNEQIEWQSFELDGSSYRVFEKHHDVFGDGSVVLVDLSGHTHGQLGMFLNLSDKEKYFFIGDTTWVVEGIEKDRSRPAFVDWAVGVDTDKEKNAEVIHKIHRMTQADPELVIVPAHDERVLEKLPVYPQFSE